MFRPGLGGCLYLPNRSTMPARACERSARLHEQHDREDDQDQDEAPTNVVIRFSLVSVSSGPDWCYGST